MDSVTNQPLGIPSDDPGNARAAGMLIATGVVEIFSFGLLAIGCANLAVTPIAELQKQMNLNAQQIEAVTQFKDFAWPVAIALMLLGVAPGLTYIALSFGVRKSRYVPTQVALLLVSTQLIVFGILFLAYAFESVRQFNPVLLTFDAVTLGTLLMLLGFTFRFLLLARVGAKLQLQGGGREPWDSPDEK